MPFDGAPADFRTGQVLDGFHVPRRGRGMRKYRAAVLKAFADEIVPQFPADPNHVALVRGLLERQGHADPTGEAIARVRRGAAIGQVIADYGIEIRQTDVNRAIMEEARRRSPVETDVAGHFRSNYQSMATLQAGIYEHTAENFIVARAASPCPETFRHMPEALPLNPILDRRRPKSRRWYPQRRGSYDRFDPELDVATLNMLIEGQVLRERVRRATLRGMGTRHWRAWWASLEDLDADFPRFWVPGWRKLPAPIVGGYFDLEPDEGQFHGIGGRVRRMRCEHAADTIRLSFGGRIRRRRRGSLRGGGTAVQPPNVVAVPLIVTDSSALNVTIVHSEDTFDFYVDPVNGSDTNDGTTPQTAWRTPGRVTSASSSFPVGTRVGFKRGSTFTSAFQPQKSGTSGNAMFYGAYDAGTVPIFDGNGSGNITNIDGKNFQTFSFLRYQDWGTSASFRVWNSENVTFLTVDFQNTPCREQIQLRNGSHNLLVDGGTHQDIGPTNTDGHGIGVDASNNVTVQNYTGNRCTGDALQCGNVKPVDTVICDNSIGKNNGEDFCDQKDGGWTITDGTGLRDGVGGIATRTDNPPRKGLVFHDNSSNAPSVHVIEDCVLKGWLNNQIWMDDGEGTITCRRTYCDDDAGLSESIRSSTLSVNGNSTSKRFTFTGESMLVIGRTSDEHPTRVVWSISATFKHHTTVQANTGGPAAFSSETNGQNITYQNGICYHRGGGRAADFDVAGQVDEISNSAFDRVTGSDVVKFGSTNYTSAAALNAADPDISGTAFGDPNFADDDGATIASFLPDNLGSAHQLGAAGLVSLDINGNPFDGANPTAGCLQI